MSSHILAQAILDAGSEREVIVPFEAGSHRVRTTHKYKTWIELVARPDGPADNRGRGAIAVHGDVERPVPTVFAGAAGGDCSDGVSVTGLLCAHLRAA